MPLKSMEDSSNEIDNDEEEEEVIVFANFEEGTVDKDVFQQSDLKFKVIGLDSDTPVVQLGDTTFKGSWKDTIGTRVFFEDDPSPEQVDPVFTVLPPKMLKYKCMSTKTLDLSRIFLKPKNTDSKDKNDSEEEPKENDNIDNKEDVLQLVQSTISPDLETDSVMKSIVEETAMEIIEDGKDA